MKSNPSAQPNVAWEDLPWRKLEKAVYRMQKRIFQASRKQETQTVHTIQQLLLKSKAARLLAVRRVTQDNQGKKTAGIDGVRLLKPQQRLDLAERLRDLHTIKPQPVRRIYIPKKNGEQRPLGIPTLQDRAAQALVKLALEPEWEAKFEPNSYGFRPGRSCHDAMEAIFSSIKHKAKYVLDADIRGCFDHIDQEALLRKLNAFPRMRQLIQGWLKAGVLEEGQFSPVEAGTPQGGVISPLLANIALHGLETAITQAYRTNHKPQVIRYADDFVILHAEEEAIQKAHTIASEWLKEMGLELKPSKTRISHTLMEYQGNCGFDFLGFTVRQYPVGKTHTAHNSHGKPLGFKTLITPSKKAVKEHLTTLKAKLRQLRAAPQETVIRDLTLIIRGWTNYYRPMVCKKVFSKCDEVLYLMLRHWAYRRHPNKNRGWIARKYWRLNQDQGWIFGTEKHALRRHTRTAVQRHVKVAGEASPYDGNLVYWAKRLSNHPLTRNQLSMLLKDQRGKCFHCGLYFKDGDLMEIDHFIPLSQGGPDTRGNMRVLHRHCHDQWHARPVSAGIHDKDHVVEEPDESKDSRPVLKTSSGGDSDA